MTQFLPPNLLALFAPRDPLPFLPPTDKLPHEKKRLPYGGIAEYLKFFEHPKDTPPPVKLETRDERRERRKRERVELQAYKIEQGIALWDPANNSRATSDPFKTLFVSRVNYDTTESKLRREFESFGSIRKIYLVYDKTNNKPRGYAFIEYEHERDMHVAYKHADGKKIDGRRVLVDVERGRTVKGWLPRRLGGGLGNTRRAKAAGGEALAGSRGSSRERSENRRGVERRGDDRDRRRSRSRSRGRSGSRRRSRSRDRSRRPPMDDHRRSSRSDKDRGGGGDRDKDRSDRDRGDRDRGDRDRGDRDRGDKDRGGDRDRGDKDRSDRDPRRRDDKNDRRDRGDRERNETRSSRNDEGMDVNSNYDENGQY